MSSTKKILNTCRLLQQLLHDLYCSICFLVKLLLCFTLLMWLTNCNTRYLPKESAKKVSINEELYEKVRVFCIIHTYEYRHDYHTVHVLRTWAPKCNRVLFVSDEEHPELEPLVFTKTSNYGYHKAALDYVYRYFGHEADWFLMVNDENFVVLENLRYFLAQYSKDMPIYFGSKMKEPSGEPYMCQAAGYVLSKEALRRFVVQALPNATLCRQDDGIHDIEMGRCLRNVGVMAGDSRDVTGFQRFISPAPQDYLMGLNAEKNKWYLENSYYEYKNGTDRISPLAISFGHVTSYEMYDLYYFVYRLRIFGRQKHSGKLPQTLNDLHAANKINQQ